MSKKLTPFFLPLGFLLLFFYQLFIYQPFLLHSQFQPAFYFDSHFIDSYLAYPGGCGELLSLFIFQFFVNKVAAAILFAAILFTIFILVRAICKNLFSHNISSFLSLLPLFLIMIFYNAYNVPLAVAIKFAIVLFFAWLYSFDKNMPRVLILLSLPLLYFVLGGWFSIIYIALVLTIHVVSPWRLSTFVFPLLFAEIFALCAFLSARYFFYISLKEAFIYLVPYKFSHEPIYFKATFLFYLISFSVPIVLLLWRGIEMITRKLLSQKKETSSIVFPVASTVVAILLFCAAMIFTIQPDQKRRLYINYLAEHSQWQKVLNQSKKMHEYDRIVEFQTNRAMFFSGCLLDSLFYIDHPVGVDGLFVDRVMASQIALHASDLYFDLGHINAAQVMAYEYQTKYRYDPRVLKRLAWTNAINGHYLTAEKFIKLLNKSLVYKPWAKEHAALLDDATAATIPLVALKRVHQPKKDFFLHSKMPNRDLVGLMQSSATNRMAFEYLMAYYLLECRMGNVAGHIKTLKQFNYAITPVAIEEAAIMYQTGAKRAGGELISELPFRRDRVQRFATFNKIMMTYKSNQQRRVQLLNHGYANTFWFYLFDGGGNRKDNIKKKRVESGY